MGQVSGGSWLDASAFVKTSAFAEAMADKMTNKSEDKRCSQDGESAKR
ncbi:MAG: hypothetical protein WAV28_05695 [Sedimentisphaerales bacterium]